MRKNLFLKSMLRQPVRTLLLVLLIAASSFAFVTRVTEFAIVREQINGMTGFFQTVGFLTHRDGNTADVSAALEYIAQSPYVTFYDRRRGLEGRLTDMHNAYIEGSRYWRASWAYRYFAHEFELREYINLMPRLRPMPGFAGFVSGDSFFYGTLLEAQFIAAPPWGWEFRPWGFYPHKILYVQVDQVMLGYPERLYEGQVLRLRMDFPEDVPSEDMPSPLADMQVGQRYFLKGTFYWLLERLQFDSSTITKMMRPIGYEGLWYVPVLAGDEVDTVALGLCRQLMYASHVQSAVYLRTTRDMSRLPYVQAGHGFMSLYEGRFLCLDDYREARPVVVVNRLFASRRQVEVGDFIAVSVNACQHLVISPYYLISNESDINPLPVPIVTFPELGVLSRPGGYPVVTLELEVVGIYDFYRFRAVNTRWSSLNKFMFIPDSLIPYDWGIQSAYFGDVEPEYTPALWFSFALYTQRDQQAFLWATRDALMELGASVRFVGPNGSGFFAAADTIMMAGRLNFAITAVVLVLVIGFVMALFVWQRAKEYAILRALGRRAMDNYVHTVIALMVFGLPAVLVGGVFGWRLAFWLTYDVVEGFAGLMADELGAFDISFVRDAALAPYIGTPLPSVGLLVFLCVFIFVFMLAIVTAITVKTERRSVLAVLKGAR